jgi:hypothetical protein
VMSGGRIHGNAQSNAGTVRLTMAENDGQKNEAPEVGAPFD